MWLKEGNGGTYNIINVEHKQITFTPDTVGYNVDDTTPTFILRAGDFKKVRHFSGLVASAASTSLIGKGDYRVDFITALWNAKFEPFDDG
jgi:hypothetical protein